MKKLLSTIAMSAAVIGLGASSAVAGVPEVVDAIVIVSEPTTLVLLGAAVGARMLYAHLRGRR